MGWTEKRLNFLEEIYNLTTSILGKGHSRTSCAEKSGSAIDKLINQFLFAQSCSFRGGQQLKKK